MINLNLELFLRPIKSVCLSYSNSNDICRKNKSRQYLRSLQVLLPIGSTDMCELLSEHRF
jgi:hypothetical protein